MEDTHVKASSESQPTESPAQAAATKSRFDDAEYARWSEQLRARSKRK